MNREHSHSVNQYNKFFSCIAHEEILSQINISQLILLKLFVQLLNQIKHTE